VRVCVCECVGQKWGSQDIISVSMCVCVCVCVCVSECGTEVGKPG
jgi:hypothetical protein